ncbi:MAG TPA: cell division protein ZapA [Treponema sp.]|nr:cell division protein ZapA [Treponema sp.]
MAVRDFALDVLGTSFSIRVDEEPAYLEELLDRYRDAVDNTQILFKLKDPLVTAVLTGFLLCDELHKEKNQAGDQNPALQEEAREAEELAMRIIARIDRVLESKDAGQT